MSDGFHARRVVMDWMTFYNTERPDSALDRLTPDNAYWAGSKEQKAA
ncbi:integrase core domain-containing protein [Paradonghicola geojensis]|nr:integrase core domain-containing protein [Marivivens geojensis]